MWFKGALLWLKGVLISVFAVLGLSHQALAGPVWQGQGAYKDDFLVGTLHIGDERVESQLQSLMRLVDRVDTLVVEVDLSEISNLAQSNAVQRYALLNEGQSLNQLISAQVRQRVDAYFNAYGLSIEQYQAFKPWMVAIIMVQLSYQELGLNSQLGIDQQLIKYAKQQGKTVIQLETFEFQLDMFNQLFSQNSAISYDDMLLDTLDELTQMSELPNKMLSAWLDGDLAVFEQIYQQTLTSSTFDKALEEVIIKRRNYAWKAKLEPLLLANSVLVATGTLHYVGQHGLPTILKGEFVLTDQSNSQKNQ